jgi:hypothetical protein
MHTQAMYVLGTSNTVALTEGPCGRVTWQINRRGAVKKRKVRTATYGMCARVSVSEREKGGWACAHMCVNVWVLVVSRRRPPTDISI